MLETRAIKDNKKRTEYISKIKVKGVVEGEGAKYYHFLKVKSVCQQY